VFASARRKFDAIVVVILPPQFNVLCSRDNNTVCLSLCHGNRVTNSVSNSCKRHTRTPHRVLWPYSLSLTLSLSCARVTVPTCGPPAAAAAAAVAAAYRQDGKEFHENVMSCRRIAARSHPKRYAFSWRRRRRLSRYTRPLTGTTRYNNPFFENGCATGSCVCVRSRVYYNIMCVF